MLYADDSHDYGHFFPAEINEGLANVHNNSQPLFDWAIENELEFNARKTKATISGSA